MTSQKQVNSNQLNAINSTGPKTETGKDIVSKNALKHGILAKEVVIDSPELKEDKNELEQLKQALIEDLKPVGILENLIVDRIVTTYWRMRRVIWAENGAIKLQTNNSYFREAIELAKKANEHRRSPFLTKFEDRMSNSFSAKWTLGELEEFKKSINLNGCLHDRELFKYSLIKNLQDDEDELKGVYFFNKQAKGEVEEEPDKEKGKKALLFLIDKDIEQAKTAIDVSNELEEDNIAALTSLKSIPSSNEIDRISRYETALENQLYKAINQLIKLQTIRKGGRILSGRIEDLEVIET